MNILFQEQNHCVEQRTTAIVGVLFTCSLDAIILPEQIRHDDQRQPQEVDYLDCFLPKHYPSVAPLLEPVKLSFLNNFNTLI